MDINTVSLIIEGMDCTGKSTIIKKLMDHIPTLKTYHFERPQGDTHTEKYYFQHGQFDMMFKFIELTQNTTHFVFDRAHIGEYIWGPEYRKRFPEYMPQLEHSYKHLPIVLIHVTCAPSTIEQRFNDRPTEVSPDYNDIVRIDNRFELYCERSPFKNITINTTNIKTTEELNMLIKNIIKQIEEL